MKKFTLSTFALMAGMIAIAQISTPPSGGNQKSMVRQYIGALSYVEIVYNSPDVAGPNGESREGQIWGALVPYGFNNLGFGLSSADNPSPWRAGANQNTTVEFSHDMTVEGKEIKAGIYGFHVAAAESGPWTLIFSNDTNHWGSFFYKEENDALRVDVGVVDNQFSEWLTFEFIDRQPASTTAALRWENKSIPFKIEVPSVNEIHMAQIQSELNNSLGFGFVNFQAASGYALGIGENEKALEWAEKGISAPFFGRKNFGTMQTKAAALRAMGKAEESMAIMDEAIKLDGANAGAIHQYGRQLLAADEKEKALEVFKYNQKNSDGAWPTNYGLARGYSAVGNYKSALKYLKIAKTKVPAGDTQNPPLIDQNIAKLEKGEDIN